MKRSGCRRTVGLFVAVLTAWCGLRAAGQPPVAVLLHYREGGPVTVELIASFEDEALRTGQGLLIWNERGLDHWCAVPLAQGETKVGVPVRPGEGTRSPGSGGGGAGAAFTTHLDQLRGVALVRGRGLITPIRQGRHLNPRVVIRREPGGSDEELPAVLLQLVRDGELLLRVPFAEGEKKLAWSDIPDLPEDLKQGLPPGEYTLRSETGGLSTTFIVESPEVREWVFRWPEKLSAWGAAEPESLWTLLTVEHLLSLTDETGKPAPYYADALDLVEELPEENLTPALKNLREEILARLRSTPPTPGHGDTDATGIAEIDEARRLIATGRWSEAEARLAEAAAHDSRRVRGLVMLYSAVVASEAGQQATLQTDESFRGAIELLQCDPADAYRAHNNYAGFLVNQAQDRLYNHAFQIATGAQNPLLRSSFFWRLAEEQYAAALESASTLGPDRVAAVKVNQARLHSLMADLLRTLDHPDPRQRAHREGEEAAARRASELVKEATEIEEADELTRASAHEILAHLEYRRAAYDSSLKYAQRAMELYVRAGALAGIESACRLIGLNEIRLENLESALQRLLLAHEISELLRERMPADQIGTSRAGFFARRTYVNELLIQLLLEKGEAARALEIAESAKARSLQDVLLRGAEGDVRTPLEEPRSVADLLDDWPADVVALEYFLGTQGCWVFVIDTAGGVRAHPLRLPDGTPVSSRDLVGAVTNLLRATGMQAAQMRQRLEAGHGFDHAWQNELHLFRQVLLPPGVLGTLKEAEQVLIVPHHVLHYFPFVALVTKPDAGRGPNEMAHPRFLLDERFSIGYAPSLATWDLLRRRARPLRQVQALGIVEFEEASNLPGVEQDLENIQTVFRDRVRRIVAEQEAGETNARQMLQAPGMILIATHGLNLADDPLSSFVLCHADEQHDGRLTAREIFESDVQTDLIVLSACYTGLADRSPLESDDLFGLQRAFLHAGSRAVVSGQWDVYDATGPILMKSCFERLAAGEGIGTALSGAQREFVRNLRASGEVEPWLHPYFWAVYTVSGDPGTAFEK